MQIVLTKKLADAAGIKPVSVDEEINPLFVWTANWTNTFNNRKEDMVVLMNNATRFTVTIYGIRRNQFKNIADKMKSAIRNTFLALNIDHEVIDEYFKLAGEVEFTANRDRKITAQINRQCLDAAFVLGRAVHESEGELKFEDTLGRIVSDRSANCGGNYEDSFVPLKKMMQELSALLGRPLYKYRAFELKVTLDLEVYKAVRNLLVPADLDFYRLHKVLQDVFRWRNYHLYDFTVLAGKTKKPLSRLVPFDEDLSYDESAVLMKDHTLAEYMPENKRIIYTYDMGDNWEHIIEFVREIKEHTEEYPFLLEVEGQSPPEDVGGVGGYIDFREIMLDSKHPEYESTKEWAGYWSPDLSGWEKRPRVVRG